MITSLPPFCSDRYEAGFASVDSHGSDVDPGGGAQRRKPRPSDYVRMTGRKKGAVSYKESSGSEVTDSDMVVEGAEGVPAVEDNREGIEKVLMKRKGRVGGRLFIHTFLQYYTRLHNVWALDTVFFMCMSRRHRR